MSPAARNHVSCCGTAPEALMTLANFERRCGGEQFVTAGVGRRHARVPPPDKTGAARDDSL